MGFNVTMVDPTYTGPKSKELLPKGSYKLEITSQEEKAAKNGTNMYREFVVSVVEPGEFAGQIFYQKIHTVNSPGALAISNRQLAGIGNAIGITEGDWTDLLYKPFYADVIIEKNSDPQFPDANQLGRIYWEDGAAPAKLGPSGPPAASTAAAAPRPTVVPMTAPKPAAAAARPWGKR